MIITSLDNAKVTEAAKLLDKKYRKTTGMYLIEGERLVRDAQKYGAEICDIFVRESSSSKFDFDGQIVVSDKVFVKMCDTITSQGVIAVVKKQQSVLQTPQGNSLVLDGLQDPGNVGTLIRTAAACGFSDIFAVNSVDVYSPKVLRSAMSAHFCVNLWQMDSLEKVFDLLDCPVWAADMDGVNIFQTPQPQKVAVVLGNEGNGLSEISKLRANLTVALPMEKGFESLNVAVAGSVIMYTIFGQTKQ